MMFTASRFRRIAVALLLLQLVPHIAAAAGSLDVSVGGLSQIRIARDHQRTKHRDRDQEEEADQGATDASRARSSRDDESDNEGPDDLCDDDSDRSTDGFRGSEAVVWLVAGASIVEFNADHQTGLIRSDPTRNLHLIDLAELSCTNESEILDQLETDPRVDHIDLNYANQAPEGRPRRFFVSGEPPKHKKARKYAPALLGIDAATGCATGQGIVIAVIDTGIDENHPDLVGHIQPGGINIFDPDLSFHDRPDGKDNDKDGLVDEMRGHGTHISGIIAAAAPGAKILPIKALNSDGVGDAFYLAVAIYYAIDHNVDVINMSLGSTYDARVVEKAVEEAIDAGIIVVAAAGNRDRQEVEFPAASPDVISVSSTNGSDHKSDFSNFHLTVDFSAPGTKITSAFPGGTRRAWSGTSMATPWVAGAAALLLDQGHSPAQALNQLATTAVDLDSRNPSYAGQLGAGRIDVAAAVGC